MSKYRKHPIKQKNLSACLLLLLLISALLLSGCKKGTVAISLSSKAATAVFTLGEEACSVEEARVLLLQYQKEYSSLYGIDLWSEAAGAADSLEAFIKDLTVSELAQVYALSVIAEEEGIALTDTEEKQTALAASTYYSGLSAAEQAYLDTDEEAIAALFERYLLAQKTYQALTEEVSTIVSDDEARVMTLLPIRVADQDVAYALYERLAAGEEFSALAASYDEGDEDEISVSCLTYDADVTAVLLALGQDEYSEVIEMDGSYFLFYCSNYFDEELTEANKENILTARKEEAVEEAYSVYAEKLSSAINEDVWSAVTADATLSPAGAPFAEVFAAYFS